MSIIPKLALSTAALIIISSAVACGNKTPDAADFPNWKAILKATLFQGPNEHNPTYFQIMPDALGAPGARIPRADLSVCRKGVTAGVPAQDENAQVVVKSITDGRTIVPNARLQNVQLWGIRPPRTRHPGGPRRRRQPRLDARRIRTVPSPHHQNTGRRLHHRRSVRPERRQREPHDGHAGPSRSGRRRTTKRMPYDRLQLRPSARHPETVNHRTPGTPSRKVAAKRRKDRRRPGQHGCRDLQAIAGTPGFRALPAHPARPPEDS